MADSKIAYFHQTKLGDLDPGRANVVLVSALHFGYDTHVDPHYGKFTVPYLHLNDWLTTDPRYTKLWTNIQQWHSQGVDIHFMLGGAGGAFDYLFEDFDTFYPLLKTFLEFAYKLVPTLGLNLDVEEDSKIENILRLVQTLKHDFPSLSLSFAPVLDELLNPNEPGAFSGFCYQDLFDEAGSDIDFVFVQMYAGSFTATNYQRLIDTFSLKPQKLIPGMLSSDCPTPNSFQRWLGQVEQMKQLAQKKEFVYGGCFVWEYFDAPPNKNEPTQWSQYVARVLLDD